MKVLVSGSTGLIGSALVGLLTGYGHEVTRLVRSTRGLPQPEVLWDPYRGVVDTSRLEGMDAVVHLAGDNIATGRWTQKKKARIKDSRVKGTAVLCRGLSALENPPEALLCASAIGYYGDRGEEALDEESPPGRWFLAQVCREWEAATGTAAEKGIRVANLRFGVILSSSGGALKKMLLPFKMGIGGVIGDGKQHMSWIALEDAVAAISHVLTTASLRGPINVVSPRPVTNGEFTKTLGKVLSRPTVVPMPAFAARLALGEMADALLLASARVQPRKLLESGYAFAFPDLEAALRHLLAN